MLSKKIRILKEAREWNHSNVVIFFFSAMLKTKQSSLNLSKDIWKQKPKFQKAWLFVGTSWINNCLFFKIHHHVISRKKNLKPKKKRKDVLSPLKRINWINKLFYEGDYFVLIFLIYSRVSNTCHACHRQAIIHKPFLAASLLENTMSEWETSEICLLYSRNFNSSNHT